MHGSSYAVEIQGSFTTTSPGNVWRKEVQVRTLYFKVDELCTECDGPRSDEETEIDAYPS